MKRIEFCGGIGAGKSTCADLLAQRCSLPVVAEQFEAVPYWRLFYQDPAAFALEKDLSFLLSHAQSMRACTATAFVCDFAMFQTIAYSAIACDGADTAAVEAVYRRMRARLGSPALVIHLRCDVEVQLARIQMRGRQPEAGIDAAYLRRLDAAIDRQIARLPADVRVVEIDTSEQPAAALIDTPGLQAAVAAALS